MKLIVPVRRSIFQRRFVLCLLAVIPLFTTSASAQLKIVLSTPAYDTSGVPIYVAGTFNGWNPAAEGFRLSDSLTITLPESVRGPVEFKFTRGSWESVETDTTGGEVANRAVAIPASGTMVYEASVGGWRDGSKRKIASSASKSVSVLSEAFEIPQLGRSRRIWLYLPPDYYSSTKRYPVLYMHDGQNVFDDSTSFAGEWGVDEALDSLDERVIVVAVDNGGSHRIDEYSPYVHPRYGGGEGDAYLDFLVHTLKPYVDANFRTRPDRLNTATAGSSMGGLISLYAILKRPDVFGRAGVFSPALWIAPEIIELARRSAPTRPDPRIYFVSGALESAEAEEAGIYVNDQRRMVEALKAAGFEAGSEVRASVAADGKHAEGFWRREFPEAYRWLFASRP